MSSQIYLCVSNMLLLWLLSLGRMTVWRWLMEFQWIMLNMLLLFSNWGRVGRMQKLWVPFPSDLVKVPLCCWQRPRCRARRSCMGTRDLGPELWRRPSFYKSVFSNTGDESCHRVFVFSKFTYRDLVSWKSRRVTEWLVASLWLKVSFSLGP